MQLFANEFAQTLIGSLIFLFFAVLFLQSGLDKVTDWKGNLAWLTGHFSKSPIAGIVPMMLGLLTAMELLSGLGSAASVVTVWMVLPAEGADLFFLMMAFITLNLVALFMGQRLAKDYAGAAGIVPYFIAAVMGMLIWVK